MMKCELEAQCKTLFDLYIMSVLCRSIQIPFCTQYILCTQRIYLCILFPFSSVRKLKQTRRLPVMFSIRILYFITLALAAYSPDTHDDWTVLKPTVESPRGSYSSLHFNFGIIVNPVNLESLGEAVEPETVSAAPLKEASIGSSGKKSSSVIDMEAGSNSRNQSSSNTTDSTNEDSHGLNSRHGQVSIEKRHVAASQAIASTHDIKPVLVPVSCVSDTVLKLTLEDGILRLTGNRIGSIVSNHQFQFDGPVPQNGALYAAGWLVTPEGLLCLGDQTVFYQCTSGDFYKLFDESIGSQCSPVQLDVIELISC